MATWSLVNNGSGSGWLPDGTASSPESKLTCHQWGSVAFTWAQFHNECGLKIIHLNLLRQLPRACELTVHENLVVAICTLRTHPRRCFLSFDLGQSHPYALSLALGQSYWSNNPEIWGLCCQKQVSQTGIINYIPQFTVGCNYLSLPEIPVSGNKVLIYHGESTGTNATT